MSAIRKERLNPEDKVAITGPIAIPTVTPHTSNADDPIEKDREAAGNGVHPHEAERTPEPGSDPNP